ncbi:hypothetical protein DPMN_191882 [Dreissena polymorpha]|uniref:Uncharacterized protein n=1 Tax=Dreissena polymorpha TaxID=45954 RepID=A0A9D4BCC8_DREPO|nr:hypothetical protein DPMN_191882 [Dreissena polymorpha]
MTRPAWAPVELRCHPVCSRYHAGPCRRLPVHPGGIKHFNTYSLKPRFIPVEPLFIPVDAKGTGTPPAS